MRIQPNSTQTFNPKIARGDEVDLDGNYLTDGSAPYNVPHTVLNALQTKTYGPSIIFNHVDVIDYTIDNSDGTLNSFIGSGNLDLGYTTSTFINNVPLGVNPSATASDDIHFSITYSFCNPIVLASNIITFTASRRDDATVALSWIVANEMKGRRYDIEVSTDGRMVQRNVFNNIALGTMYFSHKLASGVYFVRITDLQSAASHSTSFVIR